MLKKLSIAVGLTLCAASLAHAQITWTPGGDTAPWPAGQRIKKLPTAEEWNNMGPSAKAFVDKAKAIAGSDVDLQFEVSNVCAADGGSNKRKDYPIPNDPRLKAYQSVSSGPQTPVDMKPYKMFDDLWWFGTSDVGTFLMVTKDGYILLDTLDNAREARDIIVGGMKKVGLDPNKIKIVIIGHNHLDHTGGLHYIQSTFHPRVIMGRDDWRVYFTTLANAAKARAAGDNSGQGGRLDDLTPATLDEIGYDDEKVTLGGKTVTLYANPGHTPGSLATIIPVHDKGRAFDILVMPGANDIDNRASFVGSYERVWQAGIDHKVEAWFHVHPNINMNTLANMHYQDDHPNDKPLWLYGAEKTKKYIEIARACTQARMEILGW